ncbi:MAG: porin [Phocaeicola sp.]
MKKIITILFATFAMGALAQNSRTNFQLGNGLTVELNKGKHYFNVGGFVQAGGAYSELKGTDAEYRFDINRAYLGLSGGLNDEQFTFQLQMDFTRSYPLLDAWIGYNPLKNLSISVGQKQSFSGTRSMMFYDQALALGNRSLTNRTFYNTGRELGLFVETRLPLQKTGFDLGVAVTTGDGINSFGSSSTDFDLGGLKYSAQATFYPMGFFAEGNHLTDTDFAREKTPKLLIGGSYSYNRGASDAIGEGHGNFMMYDATGKKAFPDYIKMSLNLMFKYQGFTFLTEYVDAWARNLDNLHLTTSSSSKLQPTQIADYLVLGSGISAQAGYLFPKNWAIDVRYSHLTPEWREKQSLIKKTDGISFGVAKYIIDNRLKLQLVGQYENYSDLDKENKLFSVGINTHIVF